MDVDEAAHPSMKDSPLSNDAKKAEREEAPNERLASPVTVSSSTTSAPPLPDSPSSNDTKKSERDHRSKKEDEGSAGSESENEDGTFDHQSSPLT